MNSAQEQSDGGCVLNLEGELTIQCGRELKETLINSLNSSEQVILNMEKVTEIDISCLQLLCSAHRTSIKLNKHLAIAGNTDLFSESVDRCGYSRHKGCSLGENGACLWTKGGGKSE